MSNWYSSYQIAFMSRLLVLAFVIFSIWTLGRVLVLAIGLARRLPAPIVHRGSPPRGHVL